MPLVMQFMLPEDMRRDSQESGTISKEYFKLDGTTFYNIGPADLSESVGEMQTAGNTICQRYQVLGRSVYSFHSQR
jgi:hypothetical protein